MKLITNKTIENITRQIETYGFNGFVEAAKIRLKLLDPALADHAILSYLLKNAVGSVNAKNWDRINAHLKKLGHRMTQNFFQTNLLKHSRRNLYFIGSNHNGYFLFKDGADIVSTYAFYEGRIGKELENWNTLKFLAAQLPVVDEDTAEGRGLDGGMDVSRSGFGYAPELFRNPPGTTVIDAGSTTPWPN